MQITLHEHLSWMDTSTKKWHRYFWKMILVLSQTPLTTQKSEFTTVGSCLQILTILTQVQGYSTVKAILISGSTPSSICCWSIVFLCAYKMGLSFCSVKKKTQAYTYSNIYHWLNQVRAEHRDYTEFYLMNYQKAEKMQGSSARFCHRC